MPEGCQPRGSRIRGHGETENNAPPAIHGAEKHDCRQQFTHSLLREEKQNAIRREQSTKRRREEKWKESQQKKREEDRSREEEQQMSRRWQEGTKSWQTNRQRVAEGKDSSQGFQVICLLSLLDSDWRSCRNTFQKIAVFVLNSSLEPCSCSSILDYVCVGFESSFSSFQCGLGFLSRDYWTERFIIVFRLVSFYFSLIRASAFVSGFQVS